MPNPGYDSNVYNGTCRNQGHSTVVVVAEEKTTKLRGDSLLEYSFVSFCSKCGMSLEMMRNMQNTEHKSATA